jgi:hypothetical protein
MAEMKAQTGSSDRDGFLSADAKAEIDAEDKRVTATDKDGQVAVCGGMGLNTDEQVGAKVKAATDVDGTNVGDGAGAHLDATAHADMKGSASAGKDGASVSGEAGVGYGVGGGVEGSAHVGKATVAVSSSITVGPQLSAGGSAEAKVDPKTGILHVKLTGDLAAGIGLKGDVSFDIPTKPFVDAWKDLHL